MRPRRLIQVEGPEAGFFAFILNQRMHVLAGEDVPSYELRIALQRSVPAREMAHVHERIRVALARKRGPRPEEQAPKRWLMRVGDVIDVVEEQ